MGTEIRLQRGGQHHCSQPGAPQPIADQLSAVGFAALLLQGSGMFVTSFSKPNNNLIWSCSSQVLKEFMCKKNINARLLLSWSFSHQQLSERES